MRVIILGGDGFCGWPTALHLSARGHEVAIVDNLSRRNIDNELEVESLTPIRPMGERLQAWREVSGTADRVPPGRRGPELPPPADAVPRLAAGRRGPLRRAARRALFDEVAAAQALHGRQQHQRHPQRAGGDRRERARHPSGPSRDHGRLRLRHRRDQDPGRLSAGEDRRRRRPHGRAGDPLPGQSRQRLSHDQDARSAAVRLLQQERPGEDHRPAPGHRLGHADGGDAPRRAADQPLRL